ncbi:MAG: SDR family NAD(P)-dependent oxidoreductase [Acidobacteriota bacterium]|nr:SDR family NAD(P)-dependent oxidoreductase [Acidobacteriota bacterium]
MNEKRALLLRLLREVRARIPLSGSQKELLFMDCMRGGRYSSLVEAYHLNGPFSVPAFRQALAYVASRHGILATRFLTGDAAPAQERQDHAELPLSVRSNTTEETAERLIAHATSHPLSYEVPWRCCLWQLEETHFLLLFQWHHLVMDLFSIEVFRRELADSYAAALAGEPLPVGPAAIQFAEHAVREDRWLQSGARAAMDYWRARLKDTPRFRLSPDRDRGEGALRIAYRRVIIEKALTAALEQLARKGRATLFMVLLQAFQIVLWKRERAARVVVGVPFANRARRGDRQAIGPFANLLPLSATFSAGMSFMESLEATRRRVLEAHEHQALPLSSIIAAVAPERFRGNNPFFEVMFVYAEEGESFHLYDLETTPITAIPPPLHVEVDLQLRKRGETIEGLLVFDANLFSETTIVSLIDCYTALLTRASERPDQSLDLLLDMPSPVSPADDSRAAVAESLTRSGPARDYHVLSRKNMNGEVELLAYVVADERTGPEGELSGGVHTVPVSHMPLTHDGRIDEAALIRLPLPDEACARRCRQALAAMPGIDSCGAEVSLTREPLGSLHLADLLMRDAGEPARGEGLGSATLQAEAPAAGPLDSRRPALAHGGPLVIPEDAPGTLDRALQRTAATRGRKGITYITGGGQRDFQAYAELFREASTLRAWLVAQQLAAGDTVILQLRSSREHLTVVWACILAGIAPVTVAIAPSYQKPNSVLFKLASTWALLGRPIILADETTAAQLEALPAAIEIRAPQVLTPVCTSSAGSTSLPLTCRPEDTVFFQLTSGSTGLPKCIRETHRGIVAHIHGTGQPEAERDENVSLNWLPLDHVVPMLTCHLVDVYLGRDQVMVDTGYVLAEPTRWLDLIEELRVTHTWSPNFGYKLVADAAARVSRSWDLGSIRAFMNAGEQVTEPVVREFLARLAPSGVAPAAMQPAFGMAESCTCITYTRDFDPETCRHSIFKPSLDGRLIAAEPGSPDSLSFIDLGPPIAGVAIRITDKENKTLPEGFIGRLQIRGEVVTPGYVANDQANREAFTGDGWFDSGDRGFILNGRLTLTGREKEMINVRGVKLYCHEVEAVVTGVPGVRPTLAAACAVPDESSGSEGLAIFFVPEPGTERFALAGAIAEKVTIVLGVAPIYVIPIAEDLFPRTTSGKIQRLELGRALERGDFREIQKQTDLFRENAETLPDWFYRRTLIARPAQSEALPSGEMLVFTDGGATALSLLEQARARGLRTIRVRPGFRFRRCAADDYRIDPANPEDYADLLEALTGDGFRIGTVLHAWTMAAEDAANGDDPGCTSLLYLIRTLHGLTPRARPSRLIFATRADAAGKGNQHAGAVGLFHALGREVPEVRATYLELCNDQASDHAGRILAEAGAGEAEIEVCYRDGVRLVPRLEKMAHGQPRRPPLERGGCYLISGGLGGIGVALARLLLARYQARLLLLGRRAPDEEAVVAGLESLKRSGGDVRYQAVDICDETAVAASVGSAEKRWGRRLDGVFHLAGIQTMGSLHEVTDLTQVSAPKLKGAHVLFRILRGQGIFVAFSSITGCFGFAGTGAYASANSSLDAFCRAIRGKGVAVYGINWSWWQGVGMSADLAHGELLRARGFCGIDMRRGLTSLLVALAAGEGQHLIGLDGAGPAVRPHLTGRPWVLAQLRAWYVPEPGSPFAQHPPELSLEDRFATTITIRPEQRKTEVGSEVETGESAGHGRASETLTALESQLLTIWGEVLGRHDPNRDDDFFKQGGHSLLALVFCDRVSTSLGKRVEPADLFAAPTVRGLAARLEGAEDRTSLPATLRLLNQGERRSPLFLLPPAAGSPLVYLDLVRNLDPELGIYGFQCPGLIDDEPPVDSVATLATRFCDALEQFYPHGPCRLGGWSFGGVLAFEMARQLEARGRHVEMLALFDTGVLTDHMRARMRRPLQRIGLGLKFLRWSFQIKPPTHYGRLVEIAQWVGISLPSSRHGFRNAPSLIRQALRSARLFALNVRASLTYRPQTYAGRVTMFRAMGSLPRGTDPLEEGTAHFATGGLKKILLPGNHMTLLLGKESLIGLAESLDSRLREIERTVPSHRSGSRGAGTPLYEEEP